MTTPNERSTEPQDDGGERAADEADKPRPLQLDLPPQGSEAAPWPAAGGGRGGRAGRAGRWRRALGVAAVTLVGFIAVAAIAWVWLLPWYVRRRCIETAAQHGITLSVDDAKIDPGGFRLIGVVMSAPAIPDARAQAPEVEVATRGLRLERVRVRGADVTLRGRLAGVEAAFEKWRANPNGGQGGAWAPSSLLVEGARIVWLAPIGDGVQIEAADAQGRLVWRDRDSELHVRSDRVTLLMPGVAFGPWRVDIDRVGDASRVRLALDPGVPEASTILVVADAERTTSIDAAIPRSPLAHLGVPPQLFGVGEGDLQVEATIHYAALGPSHADASAKGGIYGFGWLPMFPPPSLDVEWDAVASGNPAAGIEVKKARLAVGALVGSLGGTLKAFDDGLRLDLAWRAGPIPCEALLAPLGAGGSYLDPVLRKLADSMHAKNAKAGRGVSARMMLTFDSRDLDATKVDFQPEIVCSSAHL